MRMTGRAGSNVGAALAGSAIQALAVSDFLDSAAATATVTDSIQVTALAALTMVTPVFFG
ncbi:hypothetical protein V3C99_011333 [Haemonchus contortus]